MAWQDALLADWFPAATAQSLALVGAVDQAAALLQETLPNFAWELFSRMRPGAKKQPASKGGTGSGDSTAPLPAVSGSTRTWLTTAKLTSLLPANLAQAEAQLRRLKYSRTDVQAVSTILKCLPLLCIASQPDDSETAWHLQPLAQLDLSLREQYEFFQLAGTTFPAIALLAIAIGTPVAAIVPLVNRFLTPGDPVAHPTPLLTGQDLMTALNLPAGPRIGKLLAAIQLARAEAKITTPIEALQLAETLVNDYDQ
jgi:tRNA nucleotidyltransferase (CCA-adding enzyme)